MYFEEENSSVSLIGSPFNKWDDASEEESKAQIEDSVDEGFSDSDYSEHGGRQEERRGEETVQFPAKKKSFQKTTHVIVGELILLGRARMSRWK